MRSRFIRCGDCHALFTAGADECPWCGAAPPLQWRALAVLAAAAWVIALIIAGLFLG